MVIRVQMACKAPGDSLEKLACVVCLAHEVLLVLQASRVPVVSMGLLDKKAIWVFRVNQAPLDSKEILDLRVCLDPRVMLVCLVKRDHKVKQGYQDWLGWMGPRVIQEEKGQLGRKEPRVQLVQQGQLAIQGLEESREPLE